MMKIAYYPTSTTLSSHVMIERITRTRLNGQDLGTQATALFEVRQHLVVLCDAPADGRATT